MQRIFDQVLVWYYTRIHNIRLVYDGFFGLDKIGHFTRHAVMTYLAVVLGGSWGSIFYQDSMFDLLYEYMNDRTAIGFSPLDIFWGRLGCLSVLWLCGLWQPWIVRVLCG